MRFSMSSLAPSVSSISVSNAMLEVRSMLSSFQFAATLSSATFSRSLISACAFSMHPMAFSFSFESAFSCASLSCFSAVLSAPISSWSFLRPSSIAAKVLRSTASTAAEEPAPRSASLHFDGCAGASKSTARCVLTNASICSSGIKRSVCTDAVPTAIVIPAPGAALQSVGRASSKRHVDMELNEISRSRTRRWPVSEVITRTVFSSQ